VILTLHISLNYIRGFYVGLFVIVGIIFIGGLAVFYVWHGIDRYSRMKVYDHNMQTLKRQTHRLKRDNMQLAKELDALRVVFHKNSSRLGAFEHCILSFIERENKNSHDVGVSEELRIMLEEIQKLTDEMQTSVKHIGEVKLPATKVKTLDNFFSYYSVMCRSQNIDFHLNISGSINHMIKHVINSEQLETIIGDHLKNAINAITMEDSLYRGILVFLGKTGDCYELAIYDSGIPFDTYTLTQLGAERITTRADKGGSGIGFMTTFDIIKKIGASLIINEKEPNATGYTKSVTIRFDGKDSYIIETYRPKEFSQSKRYEVVNC
jgi:signal transduction histidine kinase